MNPLLIIAAVLTVFLAISIVGWLLVRGATLREQDDDPTRDFLDALERQVQERGYIDQDGESTYYPFKSRLTINSEPQRFVTGETYDPDAWKHAAVKTHHAE